MAAQRYAFKRLVVGLDPGSSETSLRLAVELAERLRLELLGIMVEDSNLRALAAMPFAREFRPFGGGWRPINAQALAQQHVLAARRIEKIFADAVKQIARQCRFEVIQGRSSECFAAISRGDDIVMIAEPASPAERATQQFSARLDAAFRSAAAVMVVPARIARIHGPVVTLAAGEDDPAIAVAAEIADAIGEPSHVVPASSAGSAAPGLAAELALAPFGERLLVMSRGRLTDQAVLALATRRGVPVLVVEPAAEPAPEQAP